MTHAVHTSEFSVLGSCSGSRADEHAPKVNMNREREREPNVNTN